jgi:hypothetical protein
MAKPGKRILDTGKRAQTDMERVCCIVNTVLSNGAVADVNMDFNRKTFENYCSTRKIRK